MASLALKCVEGFVRWVHGLRHPMFQSENTLQTHGSNTQKQSNGLGGEAYMEDGDLDLASELWNNEEDCNLYINQWEDFLQQKDTMETTWQWGFISPSQVYQDLLEFGIHTRDIKWMQSGANQVKKQQHGKQISTKIKRATTFQRTEFLCADSGLASKSDKSAGGCERSKKDKWITRLRRRELKAMQDRDALQCGKGFSKVKKHSDQNVSEEKDRTTQCSSCRTSIRKFMQNNREQRMKAVSGCNVKVTKGSKLPIIKLRGGMQIFLRTLSARTIVLDVDPMDTVSMIKAEIEKRTGVPVDYQRLSCRGRDLRVDNTTLFELGIRSGANLELLMRLRGGAGDSSTTACDQALGSMATMVDAGSVFKFPLKVSRAELELAIKDLQEKIPGWTDVEYQEHARCLLMFLRSDYLWIRTARMAMAVGGTREMWDACCRSRLMSAGVCSWSDFEKEAADAFLKSLVAAVECRLTRILHTAQSESGSIAYRGLGFVTENERCAYEATSTMCIGEHLESYATDVNVGIRFGTCEDWNNSVLHMHLAKHGFGHLVSRNFGLLCVCVGFRMVNASPWQCTIGEEKEVWLLPSQATVTHCTTAAELRRALEGVAIAETDIASLQGYLEAHALNRCCVSVMRAVPSSCVNETPAAAAEATVLASRIQISSLANAAADIIPCASSTICRPCGDAGDVSSTFAAARSTGKLPDGDVASQGSAVGAEWPDHFENCPANWVDTDATRRGGGDAGLPAAPANPWTSDEQHELASQRTLPDDEVMNVFEYGPTHLGDSDAERRNGALEWARDHLRRAGFGAVYIQSNTPGNQAYYLRGRCRATCGQQACTLSVKAHVYLDAHTQRIPGYGRITVSGRHVGPLPAASSSERAAPSLAAGVVSDGHTARLDFDRQRRGGLRNDVSHTICHLNSALQMILTDTASVDVLRTMRRRCKTTSCVVCKLSRTEKSSRPIGDLDRREETCIDPLQIWADWLEINRLSCLDMQCCCETFTHLLGGLASRVRANTAADCSHVSTLLLSVFEKRIACISQQLSKCSCPAFREGRFLPCGDPVVDSNMLELHLGGRGSDDVTSVQVLLQKQYSQDPAVNHGEIVEQRCPLCLTPGVSCRRSFVLQHVNDRLIIGLQRSGTSEVTLMPTQNDMYVDLDVQIDINGMHFTLQSLAIQTELHWLVIRRHQSENGTELDAWVTYNDSTVSEPYTELPVLAYTSSRFLIYRPAGQGRVERRRRLKIKRPVGQSATSEQSMAAASLVDAASQVSAASDRMSQMNLLSDVETIDDDEEVPMHPAACGEPCGQREPRVTAASSGVDMLHSEQVPAAIDAPMPEEVPATEPTQCMGQWLSTPVGTAIADPVTNNYELEVNTSHPMGLVWLQHFNTNRMMAEDINVADWRHPADRVRSSMSALSGSQLASPAWESEARKPLSREEERQLKMMLEDDPDFHAVFGSVFDAPVSSTTSMPLNQSRPTTPTVCVDVAESRVPSSDAPVSATTTMSLTEARSTTPTVGVGVAESRIPTSAFPLSNALTDVVPTGTVYHMKLMKQYEKQIRDGRKVIEGRINSGLAAQVRVGDSIVMGESRVLVERLWRHAGFREMLEFHGVAACLPSVRGGDIERALKIYHGFPGFEASAIRHGVVSFRIRYSASAAASDNATALPADNADLISRPPLVQTSGLSHSCGDPSFSAASSMAAPMVSLSSSKIPAVAEWQWVQTSGLSHSSGDPSFAAASSVVAPMVSLSSSKIPAVAGSMPDAADWESADVRTAGTFRVPADAVNVAGDFPCGVRRSALAAGLDTPQAVAHEDQSSVAAATPHKAPTKAKTWQMQTAASETDVMEAETNVVRRFDAADTGVPPAGNVDLDDLDLKVLRSSSSVQSGPTSADVSSEACDCHRLFQNDVRRLLDLYTTHRHAEKDPVLGIPGPVATFLKSLPMFAPTLAGMTFEQCATRFRSHLAALLLDRVDTRDAASARFNYAETQLYPLAVLCEAAGTATETSPLFINDALMTALGSIRHKEMGLVFSRWITKARHWVVTSARSSDGKSPGTKPVLKSLEKVLKANPRLAPGVADKSFHFGPKNGSHTNTLRRCLNTEGYCLLATDECGYQLPRPYASGGSWDERSFVNIPGYFLETAYGLELHWETASDALRNATSANKKQKRGDLTQPPREEPLVTTRQEFTNCHFMLGHQNCHTRTFWAALESRGGSGMAPRFLFNFGNSALIQQPASSCVGFMEDVFLPFAEHLFSWYLHHAGPKALTQTQSWADRQFVMQGGCCQMQDVVNRILAEFRSRITHYGYLTTCARKAPFWIGCVTLESSVLIQAVANVLKGRLDDPMERVTPARCYFLALMHTATRYLGGQAVLQRDIVRSSWLEKDALEDVRPNYHQPEVLAMALIREIPFVKISTLDVVRSFEVYCGQALQLGSRNRQEHLEKIKAAFALLVKYQLGTVTLDDSGLPVFKRTPWHTLNPFARREIGRAHV